jgi:hypothetical protein
VLDIFFLSAFSHRRATVNIAMEIKNMQGLQEMSEQDQKKVASMGLNAFWIFGKIEVSEE